MRDLHEQTSRPIDINADLNSQDDDGHGSSTMSRAIRPASVKVGAMLLAGNSQATAVVRVNAVDDDGQVHFEILPGPIQANGHLLDEIAETSGTRTSRVDFVRRRVC